MCRLNLPPGGDYEEMREAYAPFDRIQVPDPSMRDDVTRLVRLCASMGKLVYVTVNNKAEGSSPHTVRALLERLAK